MSAESGNQKPNAASKDSDDSPFVTITDILHHLNKALAEVNAPTSLNVGSLEDGEDEDASKEQEEDVADDDDNTETQQKLSVADENAAESGTPYFELQRRLPDGSTRRATESEHKAADLESKLQQVAAHVSAMPHDQQWQWIVQQKEYGNQLYASQKYEEAIDVYLTVVMMEQNLQAKEHEQLREPTETKNETQTPAATQEEHELLFLQCMNNLAQSALQLRWHSKAIQFTNLALETKKKKKTIESSSAEISFQWGKLYFKRGKAHRLRGEYAMALENLEQASQWLDQTAENADSASASLEKQLATAQKEIVKERSLVERGVAEAQRNEKRQQESLQKAFETSESNDNSDDLGTKEKQPQTKRTHSSIRAPSSSYQPPRNQTDDDDDSVSSSVRLSYWEYYLAVLGRIAEELLVWMGDKEFVERRKVMQQLQQHQPPPRGGPHDKRD